MLQTDNTTVCFIQLCLDYLKTNKPIDYHFIPCISITSYNSWASFAAKASSTPPSSLWPYRHMYPYINYIPNNDPILTWRTDTNNLLKWPLVSLSMSFSRSLPNSKWISTRGNYPNIVVFTTICLYLTCMLSLRHQFPITCHIKVTVNIDKNNSSSSSCVLTALVRVHNTSIRTASSVPTPYKKNGSERELSCMQHFECTFMAERNDLASNSSCGSISANTAFSKLPPSSDFKSLIRSLMQTVFIKN